MKDLTTKMAVMLLAYFAGSIFFVGCVKGNLRSSDDSTEDRSGLQLWYNQPARKWTEALPVGNGRLGAMVFGGTIQERIQLNEDTVWAGPPVPEDRVGAYKHIAEARKLIFEGKYSEAQRIMQSQVMGRRISPRSHQTLGDLRLRMPDETADTGGQVRQQILLQKVLFWSPQVDITDAVVVRLNARYESQGGKASLGSALRTSSEEAQTKVE